MSQTSSFPYFRNTDQFRADGKPATSNKFNLRTLLDFSTVYVLIVFFFIFKLFFFILFRQPRVQNHLKNVYSCLLVATLCTTLGT